MRLLLTTAALTSISIDIALAQQTAPYYCFSKVVQDAYLTILNKRRDAVLLAGDRISAIPMYSEVKNTIAAEYTKQELAKMFGSSGMVYNVGQKIDLSWIDGRLNNLRPAYRMKILYEIEFLVDSATWTPKCFGVLYADYPTIEEIGRPITVATREPIRGGSEGFSFDMVIPKAGDIKNLVTVGDSRDSATINVDTDAFQASMQAPQARERIEAAENAKEAWNKEWFHLHNMHNRNWEQEYYRLNKTGR